MTSSILSLKTEISLESFIKLKIKKKKEKGKRKVTSPLKKSSISGTLTANSTNSKGLLCTLHNQSKRRRAVANEEDEGISKVRTDLEFVLAVILRLLLKILCQIHERMEKNSLGTSLCKSMFGKLLVYKVPKIQPFCK